MSKQPHQKQKLLYLLKMLWEQSDEEHPLSVQKLIDNLAQEGIIAERKSIYDDMKQLQDFGFDIIHVKSRVGGGYYLGSRIFEAMELKLLADAVSSSRFISLKKSRELIHKLEIMLSRNEASMLNRQVYVTNRIKTENESLYYQVDEIHKAIQADCRIRFLYMEWNQRKELVPKKEGMYYEVSPFALTCKEENYYLIAYDHREEKIKHYRVDKMAKTETLPGKTRDGHALFEQFDLASYTNRTFGMFGGREETVTLDIDTRLMGVVLDRFGKDIYMRNLDNGKLRVRIKVAISNQFFGWMTGLSTGAKLVSPASVVEEYLDHINNLKRQYEQK